MPGCMIRNVCPHPLATLGLLEDNGEPKDKWLDVLGLIALALGYRVFACIFLKIVCFIETKKA